jgi:hypothetical protein
VTPGSLRDREPPQHCKDAGHRPGILFWMPTEARAGRDSAHIGYLSS